MSLTKDSVLGNTVHEIRGQLEQLLLFVDKAAEDAVQLYDVERRVFDEVLEMGHKCVGGRGKGVRTEWHYILWWKQLTATTDFDLAHSAAIQTEAVSFFDAAFFCWGRWSLAIGLG